MQYGFDEVTEAYKTISSVFFSFEFILFNNLIGWTILSIIISYYKNG